MSTYWASVSGLPTSRVSMVASSSAYSSMRSASLSRHRPRALGLRSRQVSSKAERAARTARSTSPAVPAGVGGPPPAGRRVEGLDGGVGLGVDPLAADQQLAGQTVDDLGLGSAR